MAAQFVTSDSEHSEGASPVHVHQPPPVSNPLRHAKSTPGQIFNNDDNNAFSNPFDDFGAEDPFAEDNPNNPFNNPFGGANSNSNSQSNQSQFHNPFKNSKNNANNRRTDATQEVKEKRSQTPEPEMQPIKPLNPPNKQQKPKHSRRHSQPVNSFNANINLDEIFSDFQPEKAFKNSIANANTQPRLPPKTGASLSLSANTTANPDKKRSKSVMYFNQKQSKAHTNNKRRGSVKQIKEHRSSDEKELSVAKKTGFDISYFTDKQVAYKYLCIICENVCRAAVELACKKKRHLCCEYCLQKYFDIHGNKCPIHPEHINLKYSSSRYVTYHIQSLKVKCPYSTAGGDRHIHSGCSWTDQLKNLDKHILQHTQYIRCPFADYGCVSGANIKLEQSDGSEERSADEILSEHLLQNQSQHLVLLLKKTRELSTAVHNKNRMLETMHKKNTKMNVKLQYLENISRISDDNVWILCGSHKFWKHKYNQLFTVNLQNECRTQIRIYDIGRVTKGKGSDGAIKSDGGSGSVDGVYDPTQSDSWDVGDLGVAHVNNRFDIPIWLMKKYPNLDVFNRDRLNSIIFRCGGHLIRDKKVTSRVDAILLDNHYLAHSNPHRNHNSAHAIPMQQLIGYKLNCFPNLPTKRYNCECIYSHRHGLLVVGGSGVDKNQINHVNQLKIKDEHVNITYNNNGGSDDSKVAQNNSDKAYPKNSAFNITLEWKSLSPILRAREDTAMCLFSDKKIKSKEYIIICGGWSNGCLRTSELYNFEANKWISLPPMNVKHNAAGICEWKHKNSIVIVGGFNSEAHFASEYFDLVKQKWIKLPNTNFKHRYKPAVWIKNVDHPQIICCAGSGVLKNEVGTVEYLDTRDNKWSTVKKPLSSLLGLANNINANNWRMWRIFT